MKTGTYDYDRESAEQAAAWNGKSFSIGIFQWILTNNGKNLKRSKSVVRVSGSPDDKEKVFKEADRIVEMLNADTWFEYDGRKTVKVK